MRLCSVRLPGKLDRGSILSPLMTGRTLILFSKTSVLIIETSHVAFSVISTILACFIVLVASGNDKCELNTKWLNPFKT